MIRENDLDEAIAECQGERNPNAQTCMKLAAFYTLKQHLFGRSEQETRNVEQYSYANENEQDIITYQSGTEFSELVHGKKQSDVFPVIDEMMDTIRTIYPKLYNAVIKRL